MDRIWSCKSNLQNNSTLQVVIPRVPPTTCIVPSCDVIHTKPNNGPSGNTCFKPTGASETKSAATFLAKRYTGFFAETPCNKTRLLKKDMRTNFNFLPTNPICVFHDPVISLLFYKQIIREEKKRRTQQEEKKRRNKKLEFNK
jgi:hypothetical protein